MRQGQHPEEDMSTKDERIEDYAGPFLARHATLPTASASADAATSRTAAHDYNMYDPEHYASGGETAKEQDGDWDTVIE